jgi:hypothetical protein
MTVPRQRNFAALDMALHITGLMTFDVAGGNRDRSAMATAAHDEIRGAEDDNSEHHGATFSRSASP